MNTFSTDTLLFSKWTKESRHERDAQGQLQQVVMQDINTLLEQEMDWHELEDPAHWHMGWN